jgi:hypothetical protein
MRNAIKKILIIITGAAALVATPASAGVYYRYFGWHAEWQMWVPVGEQVYNDCGVLVYQSGATSPDYTTEYYSVPC